MINKGYLGSTLEHSCLYNNMVLETYGSNTGGVQNINEPPFAGDYAPSIDYSFTNLNSQCYQSEGI